MAFQKAKKSDSKLRLALEGVAGSGKTYTALSIAEGLGGRVALLDTEAGSASKYADRFDFDTSILDSYSPSEYIKQIQEAASAGYSVLVIDSLSHAWVGRGGVLEIADHAAKSSKSKNTFNAWREATPEHDKLMESIIQAKIHVIATMRSKSHYELEEVNGRKVPKKFGMAAVQREGTDYMFDIVLDMDDGGQAVVTKTRYSKITGKVISRPGPEFGKELGAWLSDSPAAVVEPPSANEDQQFKSFVKFSEIIQASSSTEDLLAVALQLKGVKDLSKTDIENLRLQYKQKEASLNGTQA